MSQNIIAPLAARTATFTGADIIKTVEQALHVVLNTTVVPGAETLTPKLQGKDVFGNYYDLLIGSASAAAGVVVLKFGRGIVSAANVAAGDMLPDVYRVVITHSAAGSFTYSVATNTAL